MTEPTPQEILRNAEERWARADEAKVLAKLDVERIEKEYHALMESARFVLRKAEIAKREARVALTEAQVANRVI